MDCKYEWDGPQWKALGEYLERQKAIKEGKGTKDQNMVQGLDEMLKSLKQDEKKKKNYNKSRPDGWGKDKSTEDTTTNK